jgi:hypothetical protein
VRWVKDTIILVSGVRFHVPCGEEKALSEMWTEPVKTDTDEKALL